MTCQNARPMIEAQLDGELDANQQFHLQQHIESCLSCQEAREKLQRLQTAIRDHASVYRAPDELRHRVVNSIRQPARVQFWKWIAIAASIALAFSLGANIMMRQTNSQSNVLLAKEVMSGHARSMLGTHLIDVVSSDQHTVKPWFSDKLNFSPKVNDLTSQGFPLAGGRLDYLDGRPVAALVFRRAKHVINLFTWPGMEIEPAEVSESGYNVVAWTKDGMTYWAVSDLNLTELKSFAALYQE